MPARRAESRGVAAESFPAVDCAVRPGVEVRQVVATVFAPGRQPGRHDCADRQRADRERAAFAGQRGRRGGTCGRVRCRSGQPEPSANAANAGRRSGPLARPSMRAVAPPGPPPAREPRSQVRPFRRVPARSRGTQSDSEQPRPTRGGRLRPGRPVRRPQAASRPIAGKLARMTAGRSRSAPRRPTTAPPVQAPVADGCKGRGSRAYERGARRNTFRRQRRAANPRRRPTRAQPRPHRRRQSEMRISQIASRSGFFERAESFAEAGIHLSHPALANQTPPTSEIHASY